MKAKIIADILSAVVFVILCAGLGALFALAATSQSGSLYTDIVEWYQSK